MLSTTSRTPRLFKRNARIVLVVLLFILAISTLFLYNGYRPYKGVEVSDTDVRSQNADQNVATDYSQLAIATVVEGPWDEKQEEAIRILVGSLHRYRAKNGASPRVIVFHARPMNEYFEEESSWWEGVEMRLIGKTLGLTHPFNDRAKDVSSEYFRRILMLNSLSRLNDSLGILYVKSGLLFDPIPKAVNEAVGTSGSTGNPPHIIRPVYRKARSIMIGLIERIKREGVVSGWSDSGKEVLIEGFSSYSALRELAVMGANHTSTKIDQKSYSARDFGFVPKPMYTDAACYVDVRFDVVEWNAVLAREVDGYDGGFGNDSDGKTNLAIALPLTSKGSKIDDEPVLFKALLSSVNRTITEEETAKFNIAYYIAFDNKDPLWDDSERRLLIRKLIIERFGTDRVKMYRMPRGRRVAMLWSLLFVRAIRDKADYFFQVNDDLTIDTIGWLTSSIDKLRKNGDFGVVGPYDPHNGINCAVLTQAMVSKLHYQIFRTLYPVEMRDWKTDRWLTHVYNDDSTSSNSYEKNTWCSQEFVARNGAAKTRYKHCEFLSWQLYVEEGRGKIRDWIRHSGFNKTSIN